MATGASRIAGQPLMCHRPDAIRNVGFPSDAVMPRNMRIGIAVFHSLRTLARPSIIRIGLFFHCVDH